MMLTKQDKRGLSAGKQRVFNLLQSGDWVLAEAIRQAADGSEGLRRMRELRAAGHQIEKRRSGDSRHYEYRLVAPRATQQTTLFPVAGTTERAD